MRDDAGLIFVYSSGVSIPKYSLDFLIYQDLHQQPPRRRRPGSAEHRSHWEPFFHKILQLKLLKLIEK